MHLKDQMHFDVIGLFYRIQTLLIDRSIFILCIN